MRMIERLMVNAIKEGRQFDVDNTQVRYEHEMPQVYLHGNKIAEIEPTTVIVRSDFGKVWRTATTKSRINTILWEFGCRKSVCQIAKKWFVFDWDERLTTPWEGEHCFPRKEKKNG